MTKSLPPQILSAMLGRTTPPLPSLGVPVPPRVPMPQQAPRQVAGQFGDMNWAAGKLNQLLYDKRLSPGQANPLVDAKIFELRNFIKSGGQTPLTLHLADKAQFG